MCGRRPVSRVCARTFIGNPVSRELVLFIQGRGDKSFQWWNCRPAPKFKYKKLSQFWRDFPMGPMEAHPLQVPCIPSLVALELV